MHRKRFFSWRLDCGCIDIIDSPALGGVVCGATKKNGFFAKFIDSPMGDVSGGMVSFCGKSCFRKYQSCAAELWYDERRRAEKSHGKQLDVFYSEYINTKLKENNAAIHQANEHKAEIKRFHAKFLARKAASNA